METSNINRTDTPDWMPETVWPDGSPVSNWSKATRPAPGRRVPESQRNKD